MNICKLRNVILIVALSFLGVQPVWSESTVPGHSAFIDAKVELSPISDKPGAYRYLKPELDLKKYNNILIEPVEVWLHPDSEYKGIQPDTLKAMADGFMQTLVDELEPEYTVVGNVGPNTLVVRLAITGLKTKKEKRSLLGYVPVALVVSALNTNALKRVSLIDAGIEAEILDSITGETLAVLVDTGVTVPKSESKKGKLSWKDIDMSLQFYAKRFKAQLDAGK